jgi:multiple sugar transport system permease protein
MNRDHDKITGLVLLVLGILSMLPLIVTFSNSFMTENEITLNYAARPTTVDLTEGITETFKHISLIPQRVSGGQYAEALINQPAFLVLLLNSLTLTLPVILGNLVVSMISAYGFTLWKWKHKEILFAAYIVVMLMPLQAVLVPNYIIANILHISRSYLAIILPGVFSPFGVFLLRQGMKALPEAYLEAARMDGAGNWYILLHIVVPQLRSSIAALAMLTFIEYWNLVEQAVVFIDDYTKEPLSVYLSRLADGRMGRIFAVSCVYLFPPLWFLLMGQRDLEKGIELSGVR